MKTEISLQKPRGAFRPRARISIILEPWEKSLFSIRNDFKVEESCFVKSYMKGIKLPIPFPPGWEDHSPLGENVDFASNESGWVADGFLPWKPGKVSLKDYPELELIAHKAQDFIEELLLKAMESEAMEENHTISASARYKKIAAAIKFALSATEMEGGDS